MNRREEPLNFMIQTLYNAYDYEEYHSKRTSKLSEAMEKALHFKPTDLDELTKAAQLHDIGKLGVNYHILNKTSPLTPEELRIVQRHPEIRYRILSSVNELSNVADYVLAHHEHFDGSGYPKGLIGTNILIQSRIITLTNTYDTLTSHRPYHKAIITQDAIKYIKNDNGRIFDPMLVEVFLNLDIIVV